MSARTVLKGCFGLAVAVLISAFIYSADPPQNALELHINFKESKGQFDYWVSHEIPDNYAQYVNNVDFSRNGELSSRRGTRMYYPCDYASNSSNYKGREFFVCNSTNGQVWLFQREDNSLIIRRPTDPPRAGQYWWASNVGLSGQISAVSSNGQLYVVSPNRPVLVYHAGVDLIDQVPELPPRIATGTPSGKYCQLHLDRFVIAGTTWAGGNRICYSSATQYDFFPVYNYIDVSMNTANDSISGLGQSILGLLPVYSLYSTKVLAGTQFSDDFAAGNITIRSISDSIGCAANATIKNLNNKQYFYSTGPGGKVPGIYVFNGISIQEVTKPVRNYFKNYVNVSTSIAASGFIYKDKYCLSIATRDYRTQSDMVCVDENGRIEINRTMRIVGFEVVNSTPLFTVPYDGQGSGAMPILEWDAEGESMDAWEGDAEGDWYNRPFTWEYKTKDYDMGRQNRARPKLAERAYVTFQKTHASSTFTVMASFDFGKSSRTWTINTSTTYVAGSIITVSANSNYLTNKLLFASDNRFNFVNFDFSGSSFASISSFDFYAIPEPLR